MFGVDSLSEDDESPEQEENVRRFIDFHDLPQIQDNDPCFGERLFADESNSIRNNETRDNNELKADAKICFESEKTDGTDSVAVSLLGRKESSSLSTHHPSNLEATRSGNISESFSNVPSSYSAIASYLRTESDSVYDLVKEEDDSSEKVVCSERRSATDLQDPDLSCSSNLFESIPTFQASVESADCSNSFQTSFNSFCENRKDSEPLYESKRNPEERGDDRIDEHSREAPEENASSVSSEAQRIRRKRLYSFSSSSSSEEDLDSSMSSSLMSDKSNGSSGGSSSASKTCKLDETLCKMAKDVWRQTDEIFGRQIGRNANVASNVRFQNCVGGSLSLVQRLELHTKYERHQGCVNALNFNETGTLIASGSDDLQIVIWDWVRRKSVLEFDSGHRSNVFQSKFMPYSGDCHVVSCARDGQVRLAQLSVTGICKGTKKLAQHKGTAHKLAILPDSNLVFLSCGEDGVTYQIDLRQEKPVRLCTTKENGKYVALYSIHANPSNSYEYCVGGRDQYIRIYDTRKMASNGETEVVKRFCPQHLMDRSMKSHITCAVYNYNGTAILGTYNDDDIYLFDNSHSDGASHTHKYSGHRNSATVKGVNFYGPKSEFVVSGSDCGNIFLWDVESEEIVNYFHADEHGIVNVLEPHPHIPMMATSGLDNDVKLWMPTAEHPTDMQGLSKVMKKNRKDREKEMNEPELIDSEMLWFLMHRLRRSAARVHDDDDDDDPDNSTNDDDSSSEENPEVDADDNQPTRCSQS